MTRLIWFLKWASVGAYIRLFALRYQPDLLPGKMSDTAIAKAEGRQDGGRQ